MQHHRTVLKGSAMKRPLLQTKLQLPAVPDGSLYSQRLRDLGLADRRLSLLAAPAGFGKTTAEIGRAHV